MEANGAITMNFEKLPDLVARFHSQRVLVYGDFVLDEFLYGQIERISREAPVFIVVHELSDYRPGCAANAVANLAALGAHAIPCGLVGEDDAGERLLACLADLGADTSGLLKIRGVNTALKTRIIAGGPHSIKQQIVRIDKLKDTAGGPESLAKIKDKIEMVLDGCSAALISDYHVGGLDQEIGVWLVSCGRRLGKPVFIDSRHRLPAFKGATAATPNQPEVEECLGIRINSTAELHVAGADLLKRMECEALVVTRGGEGMTLFQNGESPIDIPAFGEEEVVDVTGAGDTVIAAFSLAFAAGGGFEDAARLANMAGGLTVLKKGTSTVSPEELIDALRKG
jgi:rfaE bifunctional protein kinase chain/domain